MYLDQQLELILYDRKSVGGGDDRFGRGKDNFRSPPQNSRSYEYESTSTHGAYGNYEEMTTTRRYRSFGDVNETADTKRAPVMVTPLRDMKPERIFEKIGHLQRLLNQFLSCQPTSCIF